MSREPEGFRPPTSEECSAGAQIAPGLWATWYPQMGGYSGRALVQTETPVELENGVQLGGCFDVWIWHDGEFPIHTENGDTEPPAFLHHCDAEQFIEFGQFLSSLHAPRSPRTTP